MQKVALRRVLLAFLFALGGLLLFISAATADTGGDSAVTVVPASGRPGGLRLRAQTVDITVREDAGGVWADTRVWLQLTNPFTRSISLPVSVPGPRLAGGNLPSQLHLKLDGDELLLQPLDAPKIGATTLITVAAKADASVQLDYRQALSETQGLAVLAYPLSAARQWGGTPESLRLTVSFDPTLAPGQLLGRLPASQRETAQTLTWTWDYKPPEDILVGFMTPSWWSNYAAAQAAAAKAEAGPAQHLALSQLYQQLASFPALPFAPGVDFYARYYPAAIAELQAATAAGGDAASGPEALAARSMLARLYQDQARRLGEGPGDIYLELAASEAETALGGGGDPALRDLAMNAYTQLASRATARGDAAHADAYLARLSALQPGGVNTTQRNQQQARLAVAAGQIARGDLAAARQALTETFGSEVVELPALRPPAAGQVLVPVETTIEEVAGDPAVPEGASLRGRRRVEASLVDIPDPARVRSLLEQAAVAWRSVAGVTTTLGSDSITIEFPFRDQRQLADIQNRLARLLPNLPELALMRAALAPAEVTAAASQTRFEDVWRYAESANLAPAVEAWLGRAEDIRAASLRLAPSQPAESTPAAVPSEANAPTPVPPVAPTAAPATDLGQVQRALWEANAQSWTHLADRSYVHYTVQLSPAGPVRQWQVAAGAARTLQVEQHRWRFENLALVGAGGLLLIVLLAILLWRLL